MRSAVTFLDCRQYGQPESVLGAFDRMVRLKGIASFGSIEIDEWAEDPNLFDVVVLQSAPHLPQSLLQKFVSFAESGGKALLSGPIGSDSGVSPELYPVIGAEIVDFETSRLAPAFLLGCEPFQPGDTLLFLEDCGKKPILAPRVGTIVARSVLRQTRDDRYSTSEIPSIMENRYKLGRVVYSVCAAGDSSRIERIKAGEWLPGRNPPGELHIGHPDWSDSDSALSQLLFGLVARLSAQPIVSLGHWPNGWRTVVSLTGDVHEFEEYQNDQSSAARKMSRFLEDRELAGRFAFSVTGKALRDNSATFVEMIEKGYAVVPHSAVRATWLNTLEEEAQREEIDACLEIFRSLLPEESRKGWRSHGWSGNSHTEGLLAARGIEWVSNLIAQKYGEFGRRDFHLETGMGIAFVSLPEWSDTSDILRLPNTMFSPDWLRTHILHEEYGVARGPELDSETLRLMREHFYKDWRFEAMHLVDWHPWEELIDTPAFSRSADNLIDVFKQTENVGFLNPDEIAAWWKTREDIEISDVEHGDTYLCMKASYGKSGGRESNGSIERFNHTLRFSSIPWKISRVVIDGREWRFFGSDWTALPPGTGEPSTIKVEYPAPSPDPQIIDSTSLVHTAELLEGVLSIDLEERYLDTGRSSLYLPKPAVIFVDGEPHLDRPAEHNGSRLNEEFFLGHVEIRYARGAHRITMELL